MSELNSMYGKLETFLVLPSVCCYVQLNGCFFRKTLPGIRLNLKDLSQVLCCFTLLYNLVFTLKIL